MTSRLVSGAAANEPVVSGPADKACDGFADFVRIERAAGAVLMERQIILDLPPQVGGLGRGGLDGLGAQMIEKVRLSSGREWRCRYDSRSFR